MAPVARLAVLANFGAFIVFFPTLSIFARSTQGLAALGMGIAGCVIAATGSAIVWRSRSELGPARSLLPTAGDQTGLVTTGLCRVVRHLIYLGLSVSTIGLAVAFGNAPALLFVLSCVVPTFLWRALVEERLLIGVFGAQYASYREKTKIIVPASGLSSLQFFLRGGFRRPWCGARTTSSSDRGTMPAQTQLTSRPRQMSIRIVR
jgi:protein-S-isoprenylcysteine O-methyltransferase Ste14